MENKRPVKGIAAILAVLLGLSLIVNYIFFRLGKNYYLQLNALRLDPLGLGSYTNPEESPATGEDRIKVVFFGDSRAWEWPYPLVDDQFEFFNRGISAQTSDQVAGRYKQHVAPLNPDIVLVQVCINDLKNIPLFLEQEAAIVNNCKTNIYWIVAQARDQGASVLLTTVFPPGRPSLERRMFWSDRVAMGVAEVNEYIRSLEGEGVMVLDAADILEGEEGLAREEFLEDFLHLNDRGYDILNEQLGPLLKAYRQRGNE